jgi:hypothetical protein
VPSLILTLKEEVFVNQDVPASSLVLLFLPGIFSLMGISSFVNGIYAQRLFSPGVLSLKNMKKIILRKYINSSCHHFSKSVDLFKRITVFPMFYS